VLIDQPQKRFVHKAGGLQGPRTGFATQMPRGESLEMLVNQRGQILERPRGRPRSTLSADG